MNEENAVKKSKEGWPLIEDEWNKWKSLPEDWRLENCIKRMKMIDDEKKIKVAQ